MRERHADREGAREGARGGARGMEGSGWPRWEEGGWKGGWFQSFHLESLLSYQVKGSQFDQLGPIHTTK